MVLGTGSDSSSPDAYEDDASSVATRDAGGPGDTAAALDAERPRADAGDASLSDADVWGSDACNQLAAAAHSVPLQLSTERPPAALGGSVLDGVYRLEQMVLHGLQSGASQERRAETLEVRAGVWQRAVDYPKQPTRRYTERGQQRENSFSLQTSCGEPAFSAMLTALPAQSGFYTATPELLSLFVPIAGSGGESMAFHYRRVKGDDPACKYDCESGVTYQTLGVASGLFRYTIDKLDRARNRCTRMVLVGAAGVPMPFGIEAPKNTMVERAYQIAGAAACDASTFTLPEQALPAHSGEGSVRQVKDDPDCQLQVEATLSFDAGVSALPLEQHMVTTPFAAQSCFYSKI